MKALARIALFSVCLLPLKAANTRPAPPFATFQFGLSLSSGHNGQFFTCFLVKEFEGKVLHYDPLTRDQFLDQARGKLPSKANPEGIDLFERFEVYPCTTVVDEEGRHWVNNCPVLDDLWKLRFWEYPLKTGQGQKTGKGWSEEPNNPSARQLLLLSDYGFRYATDICFGENVFRFLKDVGDPEWVDNYRKGY
ncbi:MAG: hypothetical protein KDB88_05990 [Flavobacteriales bacterium]|nr:hypothetical protein [Flavobacteriales bacterium]